MPQKRLPNSLTEEELLESLNSKVDQREIIVEGKTDVLSFLSFYNIQHGTECVSKRALFGLYKKWSKKALTTKSFALEASKYLMLHVKGAHHFYLLNISALELGDKTQKLVTEHSVDKRKSAKYKQHFENFLIHYDLWQGDYYIEGFLLYQLYDKWTYGNKKRNPLGYNQFFNLLELYFKHKRKTDSKMQWFAVDRKILQQFGTEQQLFRIRKAYDETHKRKEKRKKSE